jgi:hypothetical protein
MFSRWKVRIFPENSFLSLLSCIELKYSIKVKEKLFVFFLRYCV